MTTFTFPIAGLKDRLIELENDIIELQAQQKDLLAVRRTIENIIDEAASDLAQAQRDILSKSEDDVIDIMDAVGLEVDPQHIYEMWSFIQDESQEY